MAKCRYCGKRGFFTRTDADGLCKGCAPVVAVVVQSAARVITESNDIINTSKNHATRISRCDVILDRLSPLRDLEAKNIPTISPSPSVLRRIFTEERETIVCEQASENVDKLVAKSESAKSAKGRRNPLTKALDLIDEARGEVQNPAKLNALAQRVERRLHGLDS